MAIRRIRQESTGINLLHNGAMQVHQRGTSATGLTATTYNTADRWQSVFGAMGTWTQTIENDSPAESGIAKSFKILCTTADASPAAGDIALIRQIIEGQNLQLLLKGTANSVPLTLSFWVKSNVTGTHVAYLSDWTNNRFISAAYTISSSGTWERKVITYPGDTTGTLANNSNAGMAVNFALGGGSSYTGGSLATAWTGTTTSLMTGQVNVAASINNYLQITGVQLEVGSTASPFQFKPYDEELRECQRYYEKSYPLGVATGTNTTDGLQQFYGSSDAWSTINTTVTMAIPKRTQSYVLKGWTNDGQADKWTFGRNLSSGSGTVTFFAKSEKTFIAYVNIGAAWTVGNIAGHWEVTADL